MSNAPKRKTSPITKGLLALALIALLAVSAYYYVAIQMPSQQQALEMRGTIEAIRAGR